MLALPLLKASASVDLSREIFLRTMGCLSGPRQGIRARPLFGYAVERSSPTRATSGWSHACLCG
jgi:hypothetical protein